MSRKQHSKKFNKQQYLSIFPDVSRPVKFMSDLTRDDYIKAYSNTNLDSILSELPSNTKYTFFIKCIGQNIRLSAKHLTDIIEMPSGSGYDFYDQDFKESVVLHDALKTSFKHLSQFDTDYDLFCHLDDIQISKKSLSILNMLTRMAYASNSEFKLPYLFGADFLNALTSGHVPDNTRANIFKAGTQLIEPTQANLDSYYVGELLVSTNLINTYEKFKHTASYLKLLSNLDFEKMDWRYRHGCFMLYLDKDIFPKPKSLDDIIKQHTFGIKHVFTADELLYLQNLVKEGPSYSDLQRTKGATPEVVEIYKHVDSEEILRSLSYIDEMASPMSDNITASRIALMDYYGEIMNKNDAADGNTQLGTAAVMHYISTFGRTITDIMTLYQIGMLDNKPELIERAAKDIHPLIEYLRVLSKTGRFFDVIKSYMSQSVNTWTSQESTARDAIILALKIYTHGDASATEKIALGVGLGLSDTDLITLVQSSGLEINETLTTESISF